MGNNEAFLSAEPAGSATNDTGPTFAFDFTFPGDVLAAILLRLGHRDIATFACTCKLLRDAVSDDTKIWLPLCHAVWGSCTDIELWMIKPTLEDKTSASSGTPRSPDDPPETYRDLYKLLLHYQRFIGFWRAPGADAQGTLYSITWRPSSIAITELLGHSSSMQLSKRPVLQLGPSHPTITAELLENHHCLVREHTQLTRRNSAPSAAAEAAAGAAWGRDHSPVLGSSPPNSFGYEFVRFMEGSVQQRRSSGKKSRHKGSAAVGPTLHHFLRLPYVAPSRQHPLAGMWKGLYGPHGLEVQRVEYRFNGQAAQIAAVKVLGDENVPAGEVTWQVSATPVAQPWPQLEQRLLQLRSWFLDRGLPEQAELQEEIVAQAANAQVEQFEELLLDLQEMQQLQQQEEVSAHVQEEQGEQAQGQKVAKVVAVHQGVGRVADAGFQRARWVPGRLWVHDDGSLAFVWLSHYQFMVEHKRLEVEMLP